MKRLLLETTLRLLALPLAPRPLPHTAPPRKILILRPNDLGDTLVITPLLHALALLPSRPEIHLATGPWSLPLLENNPHLTALHPLPAPWHNKFATARQPHNSLPGLLRSTRFILRSPEASSLLPHRFDTAIDLLGSPEGALLHLRLRIPRRLTTIGYAASRLPATHTLPHDPALYIGAAALRFATLLGLPRHLLPPPAPQLFLTPGELAHAETLWSQPPAQPAQTRLLLAFSGGLEEKCWPLPHYRSLLEQLSQLPSPPLVHLSGAPSDHADGQSLALGLPNVLNLAGHLTLRQSLAHAAASHHLVANPSLPMHLAAALRKPALILLGPHFTDPHAHNLLWNCNPLATILPNPAPQLALRTLLQSLPQNH